MNENRFYISFEIVESLRKVMLKNFCVEINMAQIQIHLDKNKHHKSS